MPTRAAAAAALLGAGEEEEEEEEDEPLALPPVSLVRFCEGAWLGCGWMDGG